MYLFFDLGSTLMDESRCDRQRILDTVAGSAVTPEEFSAKLREFAGRNENYYTRARTFFGLPKAPWRHDLEQMYPGVPTMLERLSLHYKLGILANQPAGLPDRLKTLGLAPYFSSVIGSGDAGVGKPDPAIFQMALALAQCPPEEMVMIGDRLDNDILPAQSLGMRTVWVRQGFGAYGNPALLLCPPDRTIRSILELEAALDDGQFQR